MLGQSHDVMEHALQNRDQKGGYVYKSADATLKATEQMSYWTVAAANITCTLPPVAEAAGQFFFIRVNETGAGHLVVQDNNGDASLSDLTSSADGYIGLFCDGITWIHFVTASNFA